MALHLLPQCTGVLALAVMAACLTADAPPPAPPSSSGPDEPTSADGAADAEVATAPGSEASGGDLGPLPPLKIDPGLRKALLQALTKLEEEAQQQLAEEERQQGSPEGAELVQPSASGSAPASGADGSLHLQVTSRGTSGTGGDFNYFTSPGGRPTAEAGEQQGAEASGSSTTTSTTSTTAAPPPALPRNHRPESEPARPPPLTLPSSPLPTAATLLSQPPSARSNAGEDIRSNVIPSSSSSSSSSSLVQQKPVVTSEVVKSVSTSLPTAPAATNATNGTKPEVAIFQAPLVAAFTLHHDLSGLPQSVEPLLESPVPSPLAFQQQLLAVHQRHVFLKQQRLKIEELERQRQLLAQQRAEQERQRQVEEQQLRLQLELQRQRQLQQQQLAELHRQRQLLEAQRARQQQQLQLQEQRQQQLELQAQRQQQQLFLGQQPPPVQQQGFFPGRSALQGFRSQRQEKPSATANPGLVDVLPSVGAELRPPPPPNNINNNNNNNNAGQFRGFSPALSQRLPAFLPTPASPQQQVRAQQLQHQQQQQAGTSAVLTRQPPDVLIQQSVPFSLPPPPPPQDVSFQQFPPLGAFQPGPQVFRPQRQQPQSLGFHPLSPQYYDTITPALQSLQRQQQQQQQQQFRPRPGPFQNNLLPGALREDIDIVSKVLSLNHQRRNGTAEEQPE